MDLTKIGIVGYKGRLGSRFIELGCYPVECNVSDPVSFREAIKDLDLNVIVNCAGYTDVDKLESELIKAYNINSFAPERMAIEFMKRGLFVHLSTDYVFDGKRGLYTEDEFPNPVNSYGFSKYWGDVGIKKAVKETGIDNALVIRTTILYDWKYSKPNFVKTVYNKLKRGELVKVPNNLFGNPTYIPHLVSGILFSIEKNYRGILNIVGKDYVSRYQLAKEVAKKFEFDENLVADGVIWGDAKRGNYYGLNTSKAFQLDVPIFSLEEGLKEFKEGIESQINLDN